MYYTLDSILSIYLMSFPTEDKYTLASNLKQLGPFIFLKYRYACSSGF